jgi:hypothetical protein
MKLILLQFAIKIKKNHLQIDAQVLQSRPKQWKDKEKMKEGKTKEPTSWNTLSTEGIY